MFWNLTIKSSSEDKFYSKWNLV